MTRARDVSQHNPSSTSHSGRADERVDSSSIAQRGLTAEAEAIEGQAQASRLPEQGDDLLRQ